MHNKKKQFSLILGKTATATIVTPTGPDQSLDNSHGLFVQSTKLSLSSNSSFHIDLFTGFLGLTGCVVVVSCMYGYGFSCDVKCGGQYITLTCLGFLCTS